MTSVASLYPQDYQEHEYTRIENDQLLLPVVEKIKSGKNIEQLERFAKAYLGMYLDLDNSIPPNARIEILANPELAQTIRTGFEAVLSHYSFPNPEQIADSMMSEELPEGYVLLAALDLFADDPRYTIDKLSAQTVTAAICFHFAYQTEIEDKWLSTALMDRPLEASQALVGLWQQLLKHDTDHLPGINQFINLRDYDVLSSDILLPVLKDWRSANKKVLAKLLHTAIRTADRNQLLDICETALLEWNSAEPARYILWFASAFLLEPSKHAHSLVEYCGRSKEKIVRLLDFIYLVLSDGDITDLDPDAEALTVLLRIIAPKITPQEDRYGHLCSNTRKVMYLFYRLAIAARDDDIRYRNTIQRLNQVRVMKLYSPILEFVAEHGKRDTAVEFDAFIQQLLNANLISQRIKRYD